MESDLRYHPETPQDLADSWPPPYDFPNIPRDLSEICAMDSQTLIAAIETFTPQERAAAEKILGEGL